MTDHDREEFFTKNWLREESIKRLFQRLFEDFLNFISSTFKEKSK
jgi:hypothetical protein